MRWTFAGIGGSRRSAASKTSAGVRSRHAAMIAVGKRAADTGRTALSSADGSSPRGEYVSVQAMCVGPNSVTTGRSNAAAKWRGPLSVVTSRSDAARTLSSSPATHPDLPAPEHTGAVRFLNDPRRQARSDGPHNTSTAQPRRSANCPRQFSKMLDRPVLRRTERRTRIRSPHRRPPGFPGRGRAGKPARRTDPL